MTEPAKPEEPGVADRPDAPRTVRVPVRRGDGIFSADEHAEVDVDVAGQWDSRRWRDHPL